MYIIIPHRCRRLQHGGTPVPRPSRTDQLRRSGVEQQQQQRAREAVPDAATERAAAGDQRGAGRARLADRPFRRRGPRRGQEAVRRPSRAEEEESW